MRRAVPLVKRVAVGLYRLASSAEERTIASAFALGRSTVNTIFREFCAVIVRKLEPKFIRFPKRSELAEHLRQFSAVTGFPQSVGALDGCHIEENEPLSDDETESLKQQIRELRQNEEKKDAEIKRLKRNVRAAEENIARLTDALLDKIGIARSEERPGSSGSIAAVAAPHHLASDAANAGNFVAEVSMVDMVVDTSAENVSEFILESSVDEVLGLPKEMIYAVPQEHGGLRVPKPLDLIKLSLSLFLLKGTANLASVTARSILLCWYLHEAKSASEGDRTDGTVVPWEIEVRVSRSDMRA
ncbi:hypothetical protein MTO96_036113 [Rhipicephalus appendiculatus]